MGAESVEKQDVSVAEQVPVEAGGENFKYVPKLNYKVAPIEPRDTTKPIELGLTFNMKMGRPALNTNVETYAAGERKQLQTPGFNFPTFIDPATVKRFEPQPLPKFAPDVNTSKPMRPLTELTMVQMPKFENRVPELGATFVKPEMKPVFVPNIVPEPAPAAEVIEEPVVEEPVPEVVPSPEKKALEEVAKPTGVTQPSPEKPSPVKPAEGERAVN